MYENKHMQYIDIEAVTAYVHWLLIGEKKNQTHETSYHFIFNPRINSKNIYDLAVKVIGCMRVIWQGNIPTDATCVNNLSVQTIALRIISARAYIFVFNLLLPENITHIYATTEQRYIYTLRDDVFRITQKEKPIEIQSLLRQKSIAIQTLKMNSTSSNTQLYVPILSDDEILKTTYYHLKYKERIEILEARQKKNKAKWIQPEQKMATHEQAASQEEYSIFDRYCPNNVFIDPSREEDEFGRSILQGIEQWGSSDANAIIQRYAAGRNSAFEWEDGEFVPEDADISNIAHLIDIDSDGKRFINFGDFNVTSESPQPNHK